MNTERPSYLARQSQFPKKSMTEVEHFSKVSFFDYLRLSCDLFAFFVVCLYSQILYLRLQWNIIKVSLKRRSFSCVLSCKAFEQE